MARRQKKLSWKSTFGEIVIEEPQLRKGTKRIRPFASSAGVSNRGASLPLQRAVTDLAADAPYAHVMDKLVEHYGVLLNESAIRRITLGHAQHMRETQALEAQWPQAPGEAHIIAEMDGGMVPIMEPDPTQTDRRKGKRLQWKEAKICLAHAAGRSTPHYGGTLAGGPQEAGAYLYDCAIQAGFGQASQLHAVGDGASWIANQVEERFATQGRYLIDFYHVCDYLAAAAKGIEATEEEARSWLELQKGRLKAGGASEVLQALEEHLESPELDDAEAPVRCAYRYLRQRQHQLHYAEAIEQGLPIGSGEIESAHRYVVQQRLKRSGAWWRTDNAESMLALRLNRINQQWQGYWAGEFKEAA